MNQAATISAEQLNQRLSILVAAPQIGLEQLANSARRLTLPAGKRLLSAGSIARSIYLVEQGLLRSIYETEQGKLCSKEFYWEQDIIFAIRGYISEQPVPYSIETVEPCTLYQFSAEIYRQLVLAHPEWKTFHMAHLHQHILAKEIKEELLLVNSPQDMVKRTYQLFPDFIKRVPATLVASYLNLSPVSLSRIKKRLGLSHNESSQKS